MLYLYDLIIKRLNFISKTYNSLISLIIVKKNLFIKLKIGYFKVIS